MSCEDIPSLLDLQNTKKHVDDLGRLMGTGTGTSTNEVTGQVRPTYNAVMSNLGYTRVGTFATGGILITGRQTLLWDVADGGDGQEYGWSGTFPPTGKVVLPGSTPLTTGGIAVGAWMSRFDPELRVLVREALRRSYAEAGYNLVGGSFAVGFTLVNANDVALDESTGKAFSGSSGTYPAGTSTIGFVDKGNSLLRVELFTKFIPATGVSESNTYMQNDVALNACAIISHTHGLPILLPAGRILFDQLNLDGLHGAQFIGAGLTQTTLVQRVGANKNAVTGSVNEITLKNLSIDCNYFTSAWNAETGAIGNSSGNGLDIRGFGHQIDILLNNVPEIGAIFRDPGPENSASRGALYDISIVGRDFGKEGLVIQGPNDGILRKAWIGRAGILPRPQAETTIAVSTLYPSEPVDGVVLDGVNIEIGDVHTYAAWSGTAFRTRGVCRLTKGGRIIAESSRSQVNTSTTTYGSAFFDVRSLSLLHPNWTGPIPTYNQPNAEWDGVTIQSGADFSCEVTVKRTITQTKRVVGTTAVNKAGGAEVRVLTYSNSTAPSGDAEAGQRYSGDALLVSSNGGIASVSGRNANGVLCLVTGEACDITFSADDCSTALSRVSSSNSRRGNNIRGAVRRCDVGFNSSGTPMSENIDISMELLTGQVAFSGDAPDLARAQNWRISASVNNTPIATLWRASAAIDASNTTAKTVVIPHKFLYTPGYEQIQLSIDDRSTPSTAILQYCVVNSITSSNVTIAYKFSVADTTPAANLRVNLFIQ